jgi:hypothetical protein
MPAKTTKDDIPPPSDHSPTYALIRANYRLMGCDRWGRDRFLRLASALNETPTELGARIGLMPAETRARLENNSFRLSEGILLALFWRFVEQVTTGLPPKGELFHGTRLQGSQEQGTDDGSSEGNLHG